MQARHRRGLALGALWTAMLLVMLTGCNTPAVDDRPPDRDIRLVMNCGTDVSLRFNLSGRVHLDKQSFIYSHCHINMQDGRVTISCPGNGLNWTEYTEQQIKQTTTRGLSAPATAPEAEYSIPGIER